MFYKILVIFLIIFIISSVNADVNTLLKKLKTQPLDGDPRIINGTEARWNSTRHQVSLRLKATDRYFGSGHICGGSLITENVVLTAGHCIWNYGLEVLRTADELTVVMGNTDRYLNNDNVLQYDVMNISMLPTFNATIFLDDVALLHLNGSVPKNSKRANVIALNEKLNFTANQCEVSGWGRTEKNSYPDELMVVEVPIINQTTCRSIFEEEFMDGMLCAGYLEGERDACQGDSGGPLVCNNLLVGVVSWGYGCALPQLPGVYADVAYYSQWIRNQTGQGGGSGSMKSWNLFALILLLVITKITQSKM